MDQEAPPSYLTMAPFSSDVYFLEDMHAWPALVRTSTSSRRRLCTTTILLRPSLSLLPDYRDRLLSRRRRLFRWRRRGTRPGLIFPTASPHRFLLPVAITIAVMGRPCRLRFHKEGWEIKGGRRRIYIYIYIYIPCIEEGFLDALVAVGNLAFQLVVGHVEQVPSLPPEIGYGAGEIVVVEAELQELGGTGERRRDGAGEVVTGAERSTFSRESIPWNTRRPGSPRTACCWTEIYFSSRRNSSRPASAKELVALEAN